MTTLLALVLAAALAGTAAAANGSVWLSRTVLDTPTFVDTASGALDDPAVSRFLASETAAALAVRIEQTPTARSLLATAIGLPAGASSTELRAAIEARVAVLLREPRLVETRRAILEAFHADVAAALRDDGSGDPPPDRLTIRFAPLATAALQELEPSGRLARTVTIPENTLTYTIETEAIAPAAGATRALDRLALVLPLIAIGLALLLFALRRGRGGLAWIGGALALAGFVGLLAVGLAGGLAAAAAQPGPIGDAAVGVGQRLLEGLGAQSLALVIAGLALAAVAVVIGRGRSRRARRV